MNKLETKGQPKRTATELALREAKLSSGSFLRAADVKGTTPAAATKALSRLAKRGVLLRVGKGLYFAPKETLLGMSKPSELAIARKTLEGKTRPTGATAANLLGLSTQVPVRPEIVAFTNNMPRQAGWARIRLRRGSRPHKLPDLEGALLEFIRDKGEYAETEAGETYRRLGKLLHEHQPRRRTRRAPHVCEQWPHKKRFPWDVTL